MCVRVAASLSACAWPAGPAAAAACYVRSLEQASVLRLRGRERERETEGDKRGRVRVPLSPRILGSRIFLGMQQRERGKAAVAPSLGPLLLLMDLMMNRAEIVSGRKLYLFTEKRRR